MLCSWSEWPSPGMYTVTSLPFESRTRVIFRSAEFGLFGVIVRTNRHTPRFCGHLSNTGDFENFRFALRLLRTSWFTVGMQTAFYQEQKWQNALKPISLRVYRRPSRAGI